MAVLTGAAITEPSAGSGRCWEVSAVHVVMVPASWAGGAELAVVTARGGVKGGAAPQGWTELQRAAAKAQRPPRALLGKTSPPPPRGQVRRKEPSRMDGAGAGCWLRWCSLGGGGTGRRSMVLVDQEGYR